MNTAEITAWVSSMKKKGKLLTNCFAGFSSSEDTEYDAFYTNKTLLVINREYRVNRVWFFTADPCDFAEAVRHFLANCECTLDIVTREPFDLRNELYKAGFSCIAEMMRLANRNISEVLLEGSAVYKYCGYEYGEIAHPDDAETISDTLWRVFDTRISHLPEKAVLLDSIRKGEFLVHKEKGRIVSLLQTVSAPKSLYLNQVYNSAEPQVIHAMLLSVIRKYCAQGGNYFYSWVDNNNIASKKFHRKYNMQHDGLWDMVYSNKLRG